MNARTRTIASFFGVAITAMLLGAVLRPQGPAAGTAEARSPEAAAQAPTAAARGPVGLDTFRDIARRINPGVVNINTSTVLKRPRGRDPFWDFFDLDRQLGPERQRSTNLGSGFVVDAQGHVLTNRHVVEGADTIQVTFPGGRTAEAKLVGKDARTDVALLKVDSDAPFTVLDLGDSDHAEVGEWVMAIGSPFGYGNSVTVGVVSYVGRSFDLAARQTPVEMIQTDAAINPGNSGGPLLNAQGQVIGINTLIATQGSRQSAGVGFAVPINVAKDILPQLREKGRVVRGWLGVTIMPVTEDLARTYGLKQAKGAVVSDVAPGSPADKAGIEREDLILRADDRTVEDNGDLSRYVASRPPGAAVRLRLLRDGSEKAITVTLGTFPEEDQVTEAGERGETTLGMSLRGLTPELAGRLDLPRGTRGVMVWDTEPGTAADQAGLRRGDVIVSVSGESVTDVNEFEAQIARARSAGVARLLILRGGSHLIVVLKL